MAVAAVAAWAYLWRLDVADWLPDEVTYSAAATAYMRGEFAANPEHPPFAKLLFGIAQTVVDAPLGGRLVAAAHGLLIAGVVYLLVRRLTDWRWGLAGALIWVSLPHALSTSGPDKLDRFAMLDVVSGALAFLCLYLGWRWLEQATPARLIATAAAGGLATAAKLSGAVVILLVIVAGIASQPTRRRVTEGVVFGAASVGFFLLTYIPALQQIQQIFHVPVTFQFAHSRAGHRVYLAGDVYDEAPWWSHLYYSWRDDGPLLTLILVATAGAALTLMRHRGIRLYLGAAVAVPLLALSTSKAALPHYRFLWLPPLVVLSTLGLQALFQRKGWFRGGALVAATGLFVVGVQHLTTIALVSPAGYGKTACLIEALDLSSGNSVIRGYPGIVQRYAPELEYASVFEEGESVDIAVLDPAITSRYRDPKVLAELEARGFVEYRADDLRVFLSPEKSSGARTALGQCGIGRP